MPTCFNPGCARELSLGALFCDYCQTPGRVLGSEPDPWAAGIRLVGKSVKDRYRILGMLRADETGFVHAAHDSRTGEGVALRILPPKIVASPDRLANLQAAVRATVCLEHPNVIPCLEIDAEGRDICLLYPRIDGETVARYLDRRALETGQSGLSSDEALVILEGVADGLDALHRRGVVHRGLRPAVVILTHEGPVIVPRVADACVAQVVRVYLCRLDRPEHFPFGYTPPEEIRRSEERRVGKECRRLCRSRWSPYH
jgi:serine/threonine protein kinase